MRDSVPENLAMAETQYHPGDLVPTSGIYDVIHDKNHVQHHQVTCIKGYKFPPCHGCGNKVTFRLAIAAQHLSEDGELNPKGNPNEGIDHKTVKEKHEHVLGVLKDAMLGIFRPGLKVGLSGIYDVIHDKKHKEPHQVTCVKGDKFPPCRGCTSKVRFKIKKIAEHIKESPHLG